MRLFMCVLTLFALAGGCFGAPRWSNCGPGGCSASPGVVYWQWKENPANANQVDLYENGNCVGSYFQEEGLYHSWDGSQWGQPGKAPVTPPLRKGGLPKSESKFFFGFNPEKVQDQEKFWHNGKESNKQVIMASYQGACESGLCDDSQRKHLTAIGKDKATAAEMEALYMSAEGKVKLKDFRVQVYDLSNKPDAEMLAPYRLDIDEQFKATGGVVITQDPEFDGKGRVTGIWYGSPKLGEVVEGLRRVDPNLDPNKRRPIPPKGPPIGPEPLPATASNVSMSPYLFLSALALSCVGFFRKRETSGND